MTIYAITREGFMRLHRFGVVLASALVLFHLSSAWMQAKPKVVATVSSSFHLTTMSKATTDKAGQVWTPDAAFAVGGRITTTSHSIASTVDPQLFQTLRYGMSGYRIPVLPGSYTVTLNLAEHYWTTRGSRVFAVSAEGKSLATGIDVVASVGAYTADVLRFTVPVSDGILNLGFTASADNAMVSSLSVTRTPTTPPPVTAPPTTAPPTTAPPTTAPPTTTPPAPAEYVTPESFGAKGDGVTNDTAALQKAFDTAPAGTAVYLAPGRNYVHTSVLHLRTAGLHVTGGGVLLATNQATSSVWIEADNVLVDGGVIIRTVNTTVRWGAWEQMGVRIDGHVNTTLRNVTIDGSAAAGLYVGGSASGFVLDHVTVENTRADGIHLTEGAHNGQVISPLVQNTGDDGIAVVSYSIDGAPCHDITVSSPRVLGTTWGRGISVVGGVNITETDIDVENTSAAGVYIAAEGSPWFTAAPQHVMISGGKIVGANTDLAVDHGAVLVMSGELGMTPGSVTVTNLAISGTRSTATRNIGVINYGLAPTAIVFSNLTIVGGPRSAYQGNAPQSSYELRTIVQNGIRLADRG